MPHLTAIEKRADRPAFAATPACVACLQPVKPDPAQTGLGAEAGALSRLADAGLGG